MTSKNTSNLMLQWAIPSVRTLTPYPPGKPVSELQREFGLERIVKLASNENPLGPGPTVQAAIHKACQTLTRYPDGSAFALKQRLALHLGIQPEQLTVGNGSNDVLELIARVFLSPQNEAIVSRHAFAVYPLAVQTVGATLQVVPAMDYGHDLQAMAAHITGQTRVIFIANPNNPTGTYLDQTALLQFLEAVPKSVIVVIDEAYFEYVEQPDYPDALQWLPDYPNLIVTRTFSKAYGLAGLRIGYAVSHADIADLLNRVRQPFNNNSLALAAAEAALDDQEYLSHSRAVNRAGLQQICAGLDALQLSWIPSVGNFICIDVGTRAVPVYQRLLQEGVIVRPVANYELPDHLRVSVGTETDNQQFLSALGKVLNRD